ncbi:Glyoxalase/Bleomycin resistance protein/Dihydroxybiphenyl dioxygenase [Aspergillus ambiguus]|uniref:Glyoxalase/Bleomycin resistance protein/Dihydroxybiphenyl dioxygenase n=1 Tax=Aspergillus ambiguus TaxID=176160 RepID=UPI003CCCAF7E
MQPPPINHVAVSVTDIDEFVRWYSRILGFQLMGRIRHLKRSDTPQSGLFRIYPTEVNEVKIAHMATGNGVGFEVFEFVDPTPMSAPQSFNHNLKGGFFHICVTDPNPDLLAQKVTDAGGRRIGETVKHETAGFECLYVADPWGNAVEILSISFERVSSSIAR